MSGEFAERPAEVYDVPEAEDPARVLYQHLGKAGLSSDIEFERAPEAGDEALLTEAARLINRYYGVEVEPVEAPAAVEESEADHRLANGRAVKLIGSFVGHDVSQLNLTQGQAERYVHSILEVYPQLVKGGEAFQGTESYVEATKLYVKGYTDNEVGNMMRQRSGHYVVDRALSQGRQRIVERLHGTVYPAESLLTKLDEYLTDEQREFLDTPEALPRAPFNRDPPNVNAMKLMQRLLGDDVPDDLQIGQTYVETFLPKLLEIYQQVSEKDVPPHYESVMRRYLAGMTSKEIAAEDPSLKRDTIDRVYRKIADTVTTNTSPEWLQSQYRDTVYDVQDAERNARPSDYVMPPGQLETLLAHERALQLISDVIASGDLPKGMTQAEAEAFVLDRLQSYPQVSDNHTNEITRHMRGWNDLSIYQHGPRWMSTSTIRQRREHMTGHLYEMSWEEGGRGLERFIAERRAATAGSDEW